MKQGDRKGRRLITIWAYWEDHIRKTQGHRSAIMYIAQKRAGSTMEVPELDGYDPDTRPELRHRRWGVRRDFITRPGAARNVIMLISWIYGGHPPKELDPEKVFNENLFGMMETSRGAYKYHRLLALGFSADRARELSETLDNRAMMVKRLTQFITDYHILADKDSSEQNDEGRAIVHRGADGGSMLINLMKKQFAGTVEQIRFDMAGLPIMGHEERRNSL